MQPGAPLKRSSSSTFGHEIPLSKEAVAALESIVDINHFRQRACALGVATRHRNAAGQWVKRRKADMLEDCRSRLKVQGRDAIRTHVVDFGVKRYRASDRPGQTTWRKTEDLAADCEKVLEVAKKGSLPSLFAKQRGLAP